MSDHLSVLDDVDPLVAWLVAIDAVVPPFCLEVVLADGSRYSFHSIIYHDERSSVATMRIWDFRGLSDEELEELRAHVMALQDPAPLAEATALHPKLEYADVRLRLGDVGHCVESHAPLWPARDHPDTPPASRSIGFGA